MPRWFCPYCSERGSASTASSAFGALLQHLDSHQTPASLVWHRRRKGYFDLYKDGEWMGAVYQSEGGWILQPKAALNLAALESENDYESGGLWKLKRDATAELERIALATYSLQIWQPQELEDDADGVTSASQSDRI